MKEFINTVLRESRTPAGKLAIVLLVVSLVASTWLTLAISKKPRPVYQMPGNHQVVFSADDLKSDITVFDSNQVEIDQNIFLLSVPIWNAGNTTSTQADEFVGDVILQFEEQARILKLSVPVEHNRDISSFKLSLPAQQSDQPPSVKVAWSKMLPDEGAVVQIVYVAPSQVKVKMVGTRNDGTHFYSAYSRFNPENPIWNAVLLGLSTLVILFFTFVLIAVPLIIKVSDWSTQQEQSDQQSLLYKFRIPFLVAGFILFMWSTELLVNFIFGSYDPPSLLL